MEHTYHYYQSLEKGWLETPLIANKINIKPLNSQCQLQKYDLKMIKSVTWYGKKKNVPGKELNMSKGNKYKSNLYSSDRMWISLSLNNQWPLLWLHPKSPMQHFSMHSLHRGGKSRSQGKCTQGDVYLNYQHAARIGWV